MADLRKSATSPGSSVRSCEHVTSFFGINHFGTGDIIVNVLGNNPQVMIVPGFDESSAPLEYC